MMKGSFSIRVYIRIASGVMRSPQIKPLIRSTTQGRGLKATWFCNIDWEVRRIKLRPHARLVFMLCLSSVGDFIGESWKKLRMIHACRRSSSTEYTITESPVSRTPIEANLRANPGLQLQGPAETIVVLHHHFNNLWVSEGQTRCHWATETGMVPWKPMFDCQKLCLDCRGCLSG